MMWDKRCCFASGRLRCPKVVTVSHEAMNVCMCAWIHTVAVWCAHEVRGDGGGGARTNPCRAWPLATAALAPSFLSCMSSPPCLPALLFFTSSKNPPPYTRCSLAYLLRSFSNSPCSSSPASHEVRSLASSLRSCAHQKALLLGRDVHCLIVSLGFECNQLLSNLLLHMYGCCAALQDACLLFDHMPSFRDKFAWNFLISSHTRHGFLHQALCLFHRMLLEAAVQPDEFVLASILSACAEMKDITSGRLIHVLIMVYHLPLDVVLVNALINVYAKCGNLEDATFVIDGMDEKMDATWNAIISGYVQNDEPRKAIAHYHQMTMEGAFPNVVTFVSFISGCTSCEYLQQAKQMHAGLTWTGEDISPADDLVLVNAFINMYGKCGDLSKASELFDQVSPWRNVVSWNAMISSWVKHDDVGRAFQAFYSLNQQGVFANRATFRTVLPLFGHKDLNQSKRFHVSILSSDSRIAQADDSTASDLIYMYSQCGSFHNAYDIFKSAEHEEALNWNAIISAHTSCQHATKAIPTLYFFHQMLQEGILPYMTCTFVNIILGCAYRRALMEGKTIHAVVVGSKKDQIMMVGTALLNMYGKCGCIEDAYMTFSGISERNECLWKTMIAAYADTGYGKDALILFERMQWEGMIVDKLAMLYILSACSTQLLLSHAKQAHTYALATGFAKDSMVQNALVTMYSKCSCLCYAKKVSDLTSTRSLVSWTAKIAACAQHGQGEEAFSHFQHFQKEGCVLDEVMYAEVLIACSHCGLTEEAIHVFCCMKHQDNMTVSVDHYNCLIDLFTRIGRLEIAEHIILNMQPLRADAVSWITLLGGCQVQKDLERGERAAKWALDLFPEISASFVTLSNLYAHSGRFHDAACVMNQMWLLSQETQSTSTCKWSSENSKDKILNVDSM